MAAELRHNNKGVTLNEKIEIFERFSQTGEELTGKTVFEGYPIGQWAIEIRSNIKRANEGKKHNYSVTQEQLQKLENMGITQRQIDSTTDEKIQALIEWSKKYPKLMVHVTNIESQSFNINQYNINQYAKTDEKREMIVEEYKKMQKYYEYLRSRKSLGKLTKDQFMECKEGNVRGIFGYPTKTEELAKKYGVTVEQIDYILSEYGTIENFYEEYKEGNLSSKELASSMFVDVFDIDGRSNKGYDELYRTIIGLKKGDPQLKLYSSSKIEELLSKLNEDEKKVIEMRFDLAQEGSQETLKDIGEKLGLVRETVRQIEAKALRKLRAWNRKRDYECDVNIDKIKDSGVLTDEEIQEVEEILQTMDNIQLRNDDPNIGNIAEKYNFLKQIESQLKERKLNHYYAEKIRKNHETREGIISGKISIQELGFDSQIVEIMQRAGICSLLELANCTAADIERKGFKPKQVLDIISKMEECGLRTQEAEFMEHSIRDIGLSKRTIGLLRNYKIYYSPEQAYYIHKAFRRVETLQDLCGLTIEDLESINGLGKKGIQEIQQKLEELGLQLQTKETDSKDKSDVKEKDAEVKTELESAREKKDELQQEAGQLASKVVDSRRLLEEYVKAYEEIMGEGKTSQSEEKQVDN